MDPGKPKNCKNVDPGMAIITPPVSIKTILVILQEYGPWKLKQCKNMDPEMLLNYKN